MDERREEAVALNDGLQRQVRLVQPARQLHDDQHALALQQSVDLKHTQHDHQHALALQQSVDLKQAHITHRLCWPL